MVTTRARYASRAARRALLLRASLWRRASLPASWERLSFAKSTSRCNPAPRQCGCCTPPRTSRRPIIAGCLCSWLQRPPWNSQELHGDWLLICNPTGWLHLICNPTRGRSSPLGGWLHYSVPSRTIWLQRRRLSQTKIKSLAQHWTLTSIGWSRNRNRLSSINPVSHCPKTALAAVVGLDDIPSKDLVASLPVPPRHTCSRTSGAVLPHWVIVLSKASHARTCARIQRNPCQTSFLHTWTKLCTVLFTWRTFRRGIHPGRLQHLTVPCTGNSSDAPRRSSATMQEPKTQMQLPRAQEPTTSGTTASSPFCATTQATTKALFAKQVCYSCAKIVS